MSTLADRRLRRCALRWLLSTCGGEGPSVGAATIGTLVHDIAAELGDVTPTPCGPRSRPAGAGWGCPPGGFRRQLAEARGHGHPVGALLRRGPRGRVGAGRGRARHAGRARPSGPGRVDRLERDPDGALRVVDLKTGSSKPAAGDVEERHGQLGAYQVAVVAPARSPSTTRPAGAALLQVGKAAGAKSDAAGAAASGARRRARLGRRAGHRHRRGHGRVAVPGHGRPRLPVLRRALQLSRAARGQGDLMAMRYTALQIAEALGNPEPTPSRWRSSRRRCDRCSWSPARGRARPRRWPARVVWLVANGDVAPDQVLGLTFTRKAAGELAERVRRRLRRWPSACGRPTGEEDGDEPARPPSRPTTRSPGGSSASTPCGSASSPRRRLLTEAAAWQFAAEVVERWDGDDGRRRLRRLHRHRPRCSTSPASAPSTWSSRRRPASASLDTLESPDRWRCPRGPAGPRTSPRGSRTP